MTIKRFALFNDTGVKIFFRSDKIFKELFVLSNIICAFVYILIGALGQTRTGTTKRARILSLFQEKKPLNSFLIYNPFFPRAPAALNLHEAFFKKLVDAKDL